MVSQHSSGVSSEHGAHVGVLQLLHQQVSFPAGVIATDAGGGRIAGSCETVEKVDAERSSQLLNQGNALMIIVDYDGSARLYGLVMQRGKLYLNETFQTSPAKSGWFRRRTEHLGQPQTVIHELPSRALKQLAFEQGGLFYPRVVDTGYEASNSFHGTIKQIVHLDFANTPSQPVGAWIDLTGVLPGIQGSSTSQQPSAKPKLAYTQNSARQQGGSLDSPSVPQAHRRGAGHPPALPPTR